MTQLYLIRHGQAVCNVEPIVAGLRGDTGLTPLGVQQAEHLRDRLAATGEIKADVLIASNLPRAKQTAQIVAPALGLPIMWDEEVQEMRPGEADGMTIEEAYQKYTLPNFRQNPFQQVAPGGENWPQFIIRAGTALNRITQQHQGKTIVVVCHGGIVDASFVYFFGMSALTVPPAEFHTHNTSITYWEQYRNLDGSRRWRLQKYNDDTHLRDIGVQEAIHWEEIAARPVTGRDNPPVPLPTEE
jgi:probable phosphoglycerate mutase